MKHVTCQFVLSSDLFEGLTELMTEFGESDPPFTWGENNRSLVTARDMINCFANSCIENDEQIDIFRQRINRLPEGLNTYVDLEN